MQLARPKSTADNEQLMHAYSLMLTFSFDTLITEHVLCVLDAGASSSFFSRGFRSSALLCMCDLCMYPQVGAAAALDDIARALRSLACCRFHHIFT
jgi:hypothetical protein